MRKPQQGEAFEPEGARRSLWITLLIIALVAIGYAAVLVIGGNALQDAPFARQILQARERLRDIVSFEPPKDIPPPFEPRAGGATLSPRPVVVSPLPTPSLSPTFVPSSPGAPSVLTFTIEYENTTGVQLTGVKISDDIPGNTSYRQGSASPSASFDGKTLVWDIGTLPPGSSGKVTFQVTTTKKGSITNVAVMSSNEAPDTTISSSASVD